LLKALPRSSRAPVPETIAALLRHTERLIRCMTASADAAGYADVRLTGVEEPIVTTDTRKRIEGFHGGGRSPRLLPLADWRARAVPALPDESLLLIDADAIDPATLAATSRADFGGAVPAIRYHSMMLLPTMSPERGTLRALQCEPSDPVSAALADGCSVARFPELDGWSAVHSARRAVSEHRAWLESGEWEYPPHGWVGVQSGPGKHTLRTLGLLFTAARAALFLESIMDGDPELAVTVAGVADRLAARDSSCRDAVEAALREFRAARAGEATDLSSVAPMLEIVRNLQSYSGSPALVMDAR
jgi:hypothetical protein